MANPLSLKLALLVLTCALLGCSSGKRSSQTAASVAATPSSASPVTSTTPSPVPSASPPAPAPGTLPSNARLTDLGAPAGGLAVISDLVVFDDKLWLLASLDPLAQFGAQISTWDDTGFTLVLDDPTSQGYLRGKVIDNKLYVPDADPNGLAPGTVYVFDSAAGTPQATVVDRAVHNFDVVKLNGELYVSGGLDNGASGLNRFDPASGRWVVASQGNYSRLKYMAVLDGAILASKRTTGASTADLVRIDAAGQQQGLSLAQGVEGLVVCMEGLGPDVYLSLASNQGVLHARLEPGGVVTSLTGLGGVLLYDYVRHTDGNVYAVGTDAQRKSFVYGSSDGVAFTRLVEVDDLRFGPVGQNADGRPSLASYKGKLYCASSTNGRLYRLD